MHAATITDYDIAFAGWSDTLDNLLDCHLHAALSAERFTVTELRDMFAAGITPEQAYVLLQALKLDDDDTDALSMALDDSSDYDEERVDD